MKQETKVNLPTDEEIHRVREQINHYYRTGRPSRYTDTTNWVIPRDGIIITRTGESVTVTVLGFKRGATHDFSNRLGEGLKVTHKDNSVTFEPMGDEMEFVRLGKYHWSRAKNVVLVFDKEPPAIEKITAIADDPERDVLFIQVNAGNARSNLVALDTPWETFLYGNVPDDLKDLGKLLSNNT